MPNIGIPLRYNHLPDGRCILFLGEKIRRCIQRAGGFIVPIVQVQDCDYCDTKYDEYEELTNEEKDNIEKYLDNVDGVIFPGGNKITPFVKVYENDTIVNHFQDNDDVMSHKVKINKDTLLYKIINKEEISVNSFHNYHVTIDNNYKINAYSEDGYIEGIELKDKTFHLGIQWHPEISYNFDEDSKKIIDYFIEICR